MKKTVFIVMAALLLLGMTACGKQHGAAAVTNRKYRAGANSDREHTDRS